MRYGHFNEVLMRGGTEGARKEGADKKVWESRGKKEGVRKEERSLNTYSSSAHILTPPPCLHKPSPPLYTTDHHKNLLAWPIHLGNASGNASIEQKVHKFIVKRLWILPLLDACSLLYNFHYILLYSISGFKLLSEEINLIQSRQLFID